MNSKEAKGLLVEQTARQATVQGIVLSDLEKKMMYFTEQDDSCENPVQLNEEFESQYDTSEYEAKIAGLLRNAYERITREAPETKLMWDKAIHKLGEGDHYLLVLWKLSQSGERPPRDALKLFFAGILLAAILSGTIFLVHHYAINSGTEQRAIVYPIVLLAAFVLMKYLGRGKSQKD
jgi:hypothetical protein